MRIIHTDGRITYTCNYCYNKPRKIKLNNGEYAYGYTCEKCYDERIDGEPDDV